MKFNYLTTTVLVLTSLLLVSSLPVFAQTAQTAQTDDPVPGLNWNTELENRYRNLEGFRGPVTSRMAIVPVPEPNPDDLDGDRLEDAFEEMLAPLSLDDVVEAILWVEFRIDAEFLYYLEQSCAEPFYVTHGVESVGVYVTKSNLYNLVRDTRIRAVYMNHPIQHFLDTSVPVVSASQGQLESAGYPEIDGTGITITIIDTGVDGDHRTFPDGKIIAFKDYVGGQDDLDPTNGMNTYDSSQQPHGTMTSSAAAGTGGGARFVGSAPGAYLIVIRVGGGGNQIANAVQWCVNNKNRDFNKDGTPDGPDIISMSLGTSPNSYMDQICVAGVTGGIHFFTSAGNSGPGSGTVTSPARAKEIIAVGAINDNKNVWYYSSRGPGANGITKPDIMAPGVQVTVAYPGNRWISTSGTSFSSPIAAGVGALILQLKPDLTTSELMQVLKDTAEDKGTSGPDNNYGWGVVNAIDALNSIPTIRGLTISNKNIDEDEEVIFGATTSGNIIKYEWDYDGDGTFDHSSYEGPDTSHVYQQSGFYEVVFRITDGDGDRQEMKDLVIVNNVEPVLDVQYLSGNVDEDEVIGFNVSTTTDTPTDYANLVYSWDFGDGTTLESKATYVPHAYSGRGLYNVEVSVKDDDGAADSRSVQITVNNILPVANAGLNREAFEDEYIYFTAADSYDTPTDMLGLNYTWELGDGQKVYQKDFYYAYTDSKQYTVSLTVADNDGGKDKAFVYANVKNVVPTAAILEDELELLEDDKFSLHGVANDSESDIKQLEYFWDFDDGTESAWDTDNFAVSHIYKNEGKYNIKFKVKDDDGALSFATLDVEVTNLPPEAMFSASKMEVWEDEAVYFDASETSDTPTDYKKLQYNWDFDDGSTGTGKTTEHVFRRAGLFLVTLTVVDDDKEESIHSQLVTVKNLAPNAVLTVDREVAYPGDVLNFTGKSSWDSSSDLVTLVYRWDFGDTTSDTGRDIQHSFARAGEYQVTLTVSDDDGGFNTAAVTITILEKPEASGISKVLDLGTTEGVLILVVIIMVMVLMFLMMFAVIVSRSRKKRSSPYGQIGAGRRKRRRKTLVTKPAPDPRMAYYQDQQAQMAAYGLQPGQYYQYGQDQGMSVQPQAFGGMGMYEAQAYAQLPQSTQQQFGQPQPDQAPIFTGEVYDGEIATPEERYGYRMGSSADFFSAGAPLVPQLPRLPAADEQAVEEDTSLRFKRPVQEPGPSLDEMPEGEKRERDRKFCGNCGEAVNSKWFVCPNCKGML